VASVDLRDVLDQAVARVRRRAPGVTFEVAAELWVVEGEAPALERAFTNLLDNAAKWSPPDGTVVVTLTEGTLTVDDSGPGITEADSTQVFDRFWRSDEARSMPGSGLGLAIVRQVVDRHSGAVDVGPSPTGGARFTMWLPGGVHV